MSPIDPDQQHWRQRLSDYLDNRLDGAERAEIEQLIHDEGESKEPGLRSQLDQMRYLRDSLKQLDTQDARHQLDVGFADRVLEASVRRAIDEGASSDHPLIRLASQPGSNPSVAAVSQNAPTWNRRTLAVVVSIAASIALGVFVVNHHPAPGDLANDQPLSLAQIDLAPNDENSVDETVSSGRPVGPVVAAIAVDRMPEPDRSPQPRTIQPRTIQPRTIQPRTIHAAATQPPATRDDRSIVNSTVAMPQGVSSSELSGKLSAVMVLEVKQTESGRVMGAVRRAMREAEIQMSDHKSLTAEIAETASQTVGLGSEEMVSMVYLQASAKSIDRFYANLFGDRVGVQSVSLAIATNAPVLELVNAVDLVDATTVTSSSGSATLLSGEIAPLENLNFTEASSELMRGMTLSSGPDFTAQLIVVIR